MHGRDKSEGGEDGSRRRKKEGTRTGKEEEMGSACRWDEGEVRRREEEKEGRIKDWEKEIMSKVNVM